MRKRIIIEIQRIEYDYNFDRFLHYFLMAIAEQQKRSKAYGIEQTVYLIVVLTAPYKIFDRADKPIKDEVLLLKLNPKTLSGVERDLYGHQFVCLNPNHPEENTPAAIRDWLDLIYQSIHSPERPSINEENAGISRAAQLISFENLSPEEREQSKNKEASKEVKAIFAFEVAEKIAIKLLKEGLSIEKVAEITDITETKVAKIFKNIKHPD